MKRILAVLVLATSFAAFADDAPAADAKAEKKTDKKAAKKGAKKGGDEKKADDAAAPK